MMFVTQRTAIASLLVLGNGLTVQANPGWFVQPKTQTRQLSECFAPGSMTCSNEEDMCDEINGHAYWTVSGTDAFGECFTKCVAESDLEYILDKGDYECGPCRVCSNNHRCKIDGKDVKFTIFEIKDGKCKEKCEKEDKIPEMLSEGYQCGFCETPETRSLTIDPNGVPPTPDKCTLKRKDRVMRYEPNWPALEEDVIVQIRADRSGNIYNFTVIETEESQFVIEDEQAFMDMYDENLDKDDQGVSVRFVSPRGPGGWNSCNYSPIAVDLNRDGVITRIEPKDVGREEGWTIDITGDGEEEYLNEWFGPEDGILVDLSHKYEMFEAQASKQRRRVQDLVITGVHLLGDQGGQYTDGFAKLKNRDTNRDGIVNGEELNGFHIWTDSNSNARLNDGELSNLSDHNIVGLRVNHVGLQSTAILSNGEEILTQDLWLHR